MLTCKHCLCEIAENSRFCSQCGQPVEQARAAAPEDIAQTGTVAPPATEENVSLPNPPAPDVKPEAPAPETRSESALKPPRPPEDYCKKCGARLPQSCMYCLICGTKAGDEPPPQEPTITSTFDFPIMPDVYTRRAERKGSRLIVVGAFIAVLLILSAAALWLSQALPRLSAANKAKARDALVYIVDGESLRIKTPLMSEPEEIESGLSGTPGGNIARTSPNGQYIAYLNSHNTLGRLYLRDFSKIPSQDSSEPLSVLVAEGVTNEFFFTDNNLALVYLTAGSELEFTDFSDTRAIDSGVSGIVAHSGSLVLYSKQAGVNGGQVSELYLASLTDGPDSTRKIAEGVLELCDFTPSLDKFVYIRRNADGTRDVIGRDIKQNVAKTLVVGLSGDVISVDARTFSLLFQTSAPNPIRYDTVIDDDMLRQDLKTDEPDLEDYPLLNEFYDKYGVDADYEGSLFYEDIVDEKAQFEAAMDAYEQKQARDKLRDSITAELEEFADDNPLLYSLYLCQNGEVVKLADSSYTDFIGSTLDMDKGFVIWPYADIQGLKRVPISEYERVVGTGTLLQYLSGHLSQNLCLRQSGYSAATLDIGAGPFYLSGWQLAENASGIYFAAGEGCPVLSHDLNACSLYYAPIENGVPGNISLKDENVYQTGPVLSDGRLLYYKGMSGGLCDLYLIGETGSGQRIGDDVAVSDGFLMIENDGKTLFYLEHFNKTSRSGDLFMLTNQNRQIASDVCGVYYHSDALVYFLRGLKDGKADLYSFGDSGLQFVDSNVTAVMD